jgi:hypothetical protein
MKVKDISAKELIHLLDENYVLFYRILDKYFHEHHLEDVEKRLAETWFRGGGIHRILLRVMGDFLNNSPERLINFYKDCQRKEESPHYEDLITTLFVAIISAVVSVLTSKALEKLDIIFKRRKTKLNIQDTMKKLLNENEDVDFEKVADLLSDFESPLQYVLVGILLRERMWKKEISKEQHDKQLLKIEKQGVPPEMLKEVEKRLNLNSSKDGKILPNVARELAEKLADHKIK